MPFDKRYKPPEENIWEGRIDKPETPETFRWHQIIKSIDLRDMDTELIKQNAPGFCFIGYKVDEGIIRNKGRKGASEAPVYIRNAMANFPFNFKNTPELIDAGDIYCPDKNLEESQETLSTAVEKIITLNLFPIVLGGGHDVAYGNFKGVLNSILKNENNRNPTIGIINFDAHFDLRPYEDSHHSGNSFSLMADLCKKREIDFSYFCLGIQKFSNTSHLFKKAEELKTKYIYAKDIIHDSLDELYREIDIFTDKCDHIYLTVCTDVFPAAYAPGVSAPQPVGLNVETGLKLIEHIADKEKLVSFDIAEVSPELDRDNITAKLAAVIIYSIINTILS